MRVAGRVPHGLGNPGLEPLRNHVLEPLRLFVDLVPAVTQHLHEEGLEKPVMAKHLQRHPPPGIGQANAPVPGVLHQTELGEPAHHLGHRRRPHTEPRGQRLGAHALPILSEQQDLFEIILLRFREHGALTPVQIVVGIPSHHIFRLP